VNTILERDFVRTQLGEFGLDPSLILYLPSWKKDGAAIMSEDAYGRTCYVYGATWGLQGMTLDGINDYIDFRRIPQIEGTAALWTIQCWLKYGPADAILYRSPFSYDDNDVLGNTDLYTYYNVDDDGLRYQIGGGGAELSELGIGLSDQKWHFFEMSKTATNVIIRFDGVEKASTAHVGDNFTSSHILRIGVGANINFWKGLVGDFIVYTGRTLSLLEHQHNYRATKWRYI